MGETVAAFYAGLFSSVSLGFVPGSNHVNRFRHGFSYVPFLNFPYDLSSVSLWSVNKKKPLSTVKQAHGCHGDEGLEQPHWVASVAALQNSDTVASGASGCESPYQLLTISDTYLMHNTLN